MGIVKAVMARTLRDYEVRVKVIVASTSKREAKEFVEELMKEAMKKYPDILGYEIL